MGPVAMLRPPFGTSSQTQPDGRSAYSVIPFRLGQRTSPLSARARPISPGVRSSSPSGTSSTPQASSSRRVVGAVAQNPGGDGQVTDACAARLKAAND